MEWKTVGEWSTDKLTILSHSIKLEMLWELMRLYDWRIITYISSFPVVYDRNRDVSLESSFTCPPFFVFIGGHVDDSRRKVCNLATSARWPRPFFSIPGFMEESSTGRLLIQECGGSRYAVNPSLWRRCRNGQFMSPWPFL